MRKKRVVNVLLYNIKPLILFQILYKLLLSIILIPTAVGIFNLNMLITGYKYITFENISSFLFNPITLIFLFLIIVFLSIISLFDISTMIIIFDQSYHKKKIRLSDAVKISFARCIKCLKLKNILLAFLVLFLIPFLNVGISSNVITSIRIPEFIVDFCVSKKILFNCLMGLYLFLIILLMRWIYSIHYMILEDKSFIEAIKASNNLIKGYKIKDLFKIVLVQVLLTLIYSLFVVLGILLIYVLHNIFNNNIIESIFITLVWLVIGFSLIISSLVSNGLSYGLLSNLFYNHKVCKNEEIISIEYREIIKDKNNNYLFKRVFIIFSILLFTCCCFLTYQVISGKTHINIEHMKNIGVTAHRGASMNYPENTMAAFNGAYELGADWIELDLQQTKDRQIVVTHDSNLSRITGLKKSVNDVTYDKIKNLDAGSFFDSKYSDERIPLLSEVIEFAKEKNVKLNIELKPTGREVDFEKDVVEIIKKYDFEDDCVVTSQSYEAISKVKDLDSNIKTVYVMVLAIGNIVELDKADAFSVEAMNVNSNLVKTVHNAGCELYVWTINTDESVRKMVELGVDNIITDDVVMVKNTISRYHRSNIINRFIDLLK